MATTFRFSMRAEVLAVDEGGMAKPMATPFYCDYVNLDRHNLAVVEAAAAKGVNAFLQALVAASFEQAVQKKLIPDAEVAAFKDAINEA